MTYAGDYRNSPTTGELEVFDGARWRDTKTSAWHRVYRFMREYFEDHDHCKILHEDGGKATNALFAALARSGFQITETHDSLRDVQ